VIAPQRQTSYGRALSAGNIKLTAKERGRLENGVFQNFGEPAHRVIAEFLAGVQKESRKESLVGPNTATEQLANSHQGIVLVYPVREDEDEDLSIGFEMLFPQNDLGFNVNFTVRNKSEQGSVIVSA
jgi:hypothetical protein